MCEDEQTDGFWNGHLMGARRLQAEKEIKMQGCLSVALLGSA